MARIAVFASGNGSNFEALADSFKNDEENEIIVLVCNIENAFVLERAKRLNIPFVLVKYEKGLKDSAEKKNSGYSFKKQD